MITVRRYPPELEAHEESLARLDDHLTEDEMRARFAGIDRLAVLAKWTPEPPVIRGEYPWQTFLGIVGIVVMVLGAAAALFGMRQAHGAESLPSFSVVEMTACRETFPGLPALAERLAVNPAAPGATLEVALSMCDGTRYDFFALINAALDRVDRAIKRSE